MVVSIEILKALISDPGWCSCNIFSNYNHAVSAITPNVYSAVFYCKGEIIKEYW